jgi:hypothetical protein
MDHARTRREKRLALMFWTGIIIGTPFGLWLIIHLILGVRYIPHSRVGIVEKLWSGKGSLGGRPHHRARR